MNNYISRIMDDEIRRKLKVTGAVVIKGPKWCGKTTTAKQFVNSDIDLQSSETSNRYKKIAENDIMLLLEGNKPRLIDEWQEIPQIWNAVRTDVDKQNEPGLYILTGSTTPKDEETKQLHSGVGRMSFVEMKPMTLFETGDSNGSVSLKEIRDGNIKLSGQTSDINYERLAYLTCRGGWPSALKLDEDAALDVSKEYIKALTESDISRVDGRNRNPDLANHILRSYARNVSTVESDKTLFEDIQYNYGSVSESTLFEYINILKRLYVIDEVESWNPNLRSKTSIRTSPKKGFIDPSITTAAMDISPKELALDPETFGLLFENLVYRDLSVYVSKIGGYVKHYRDRYGLECDHVIHFDNGKYGLVQTKLGSSGIEQGIEKLRQLKALIIEKNKKRRTVKEPDFMMVINGYDMAYTTEDGILIVPVGCLRN
jgi:predicted AAA+ superfamily ATPase